MDLGINTSDSDDDIPVPVPPVPKATKKARTPPPPITAATPAKRTNFARVLLYVIAIINGWMYAAYFSPVGNLGDSESAFIASFDRRNNAIVFTLAIAGLACSKPHRH